MPLKQLNIGDIVGNFKITGTSIIYNEKYGWNESWVDTLCLKCETTEKTYKWHILNQEVRKNSNYMCRMCSIGGNVVGQIFGNFKVLKQYFGGKGNRVLVDVECLNCNREQKEYALTYIKQCGKDFPDRVCIDCRKDEKKENKKDPRERILKRYTTYSEKNIPFDLSKEEFFSLIMSDCFYCGKKAIETSEEDIPTISKSVNFYNGVDRLDSSLGYTVDNTVPCCKPCNMMKKNTPVNVFLQQIERIYKHKIGQSAAKHC